MGPRALLLSPDDQAVNAITGVLEELSVSCERPLDGVSAAKKLNSERFDLVLVDCDNLPAAKLIFDVCRRSHGAATVAIAIVDGRVGLPTAFRLGAELILTKPVAKDQARITVRTAVGRIKKDQPVPGTKPEVPAVEAIHEEEGENTAPKALAQAAAASATPNAASFATEAVAATSPVIPVTAPSPEPPKAAAPAPTPVMSTTPALNAAAAELFEAKPSLETKAEPALSIAVAATTSKPTSASAAPKRDISAEKEISEDPVMKALESEEPSSPSPIFSAYERPKPRRGRGGLVTVLVLAIFGGGGYAAWMYQPGFREFVQARLSEANALLGPQTQRVVSAITKAPAPPKPVQTPRPQAAPVTARAAAATPAPTTTNAANGAQVQAPASGLTTPAAAVAPSTDQNVPAVEDQKKSAAPAPADNDLAETKGAVILSSKGAEKRLLHRVAPVLSAAARAQATEPTVVLKAVIDENGVVKSLQPVEGDTVLADAAMKAVKQWRYKPYTRDGKALAFETIVLVDFQ